MVEAFPCKVNMEIVDDDMVQKTTRTMGISKDILEDLCSRFLINIPEEERKDMVRICFQIELAHWFYLDFYRQEDPQLPGYGVQQFMEIIFNEFPFLNKEGRNFQEIFSNWKKYKCEVPVFGAIMLDELLENCILVRGYIKRISWGFPKGKVNKDEESVDCAVREVKEETGFDVTKLIDENEYLEWDFHGHRVRLYIVPFVPSSSIFKPRTKGEIKEIKWFPIDALPAHKKDTNPRDRLGLNASSFFMVIPFIKDLRKWVSHRKQNMLGITTMQKSIPVKQSQYSAFTLVDSAKEEEERLLRRKQEEQKRFQEIQLSNHPLLDNFPKNEKILKDLLGLNSQKTKSKKGNEKEKKSERQPEAIRKLLNGTVDFPPENKVENQPSRGFGLPPGYLEKKKQTETLSSRDSPKKKVSGKSNTSKGIIAFPTEESASIKFPEGENWEQAIEEGNDVESQFGQISHFTLKKETCFKSSVFHASSNEHLPSRGWYDKLPENVGMPENRVNYKEETFAFDVFQTKSKIGSKTYAKKGMKFFANQDESFRFEIPEFLTFKFDTNALIATLPPETVFKCSN